MVRRRLSFFHLDGVAFEFHIEMFTLKGSIDEAGRDYLQVRAAFLEKFSKKQEPQENIREATDAVLHEKDLLPSLERLDVLCSRAGFNAEAKFGFLRVTVTKIPPVATFSMYHRV